MSDKKAKSHTETQVAAAVIGSFSVKKTFCSSDCARKVAEP
jgi:hypothetical protein